MEHIHALPEGFQLQDYQFKKVLGSGGFGIVYLAHDLHLDKEVVIKEYLPTDLATREHNQTTVIAKSHADQATYQWGLERFVEEAKAIAKFDHPNIVKIYRFFKTNNTAYMVMEKAGRMSLEDYLEKSKVLNQEQVEALLYPLLDALQEMHTLGLLHRDLKPSNVLIRDNNTPVLIDFGSARQSVTSKTKALTTIVTPGYAPPEQYDQKGIDQGPWTDIYALGAMLYRCVTGEVPPEVTGRLLNDRLVPVKKAAKGNFSASLLALIDACLILSLKNRPKNVEELRKILGQPQTNSSQPPSKPDLTDPLDAGRKGVWQTFFVMLLGILSSFVGKIAFDLGFYDGNFGASFFTSFLAIVLFIWYPWWKWKQLCSLAKILSFIPVIITPLFVIFAMVFDAMDWVWFGGGRYDDGASGAIVGIFIGLILFTVFFLPRQKNFSVLAGSFAWWILSLMVMVWLGMWYNIHENASLQNILFFITAIAFFILQSLHYWRSRQPNTVNIADIWYWNTVFFYMGIITLSLVYDMSWRATYTATGIVALLATIRHTRYMITNWKRMVLTNKIWNGYSILAWLFIALAFFSNAN